jgi:branched-chain amino acid transport system substrate-binding protein
MKKLRLFVVVGLVFVAMLMAIPCAFGKNVKPIKIGIIMSLTGAEANFGNMIHNSNMMAFHDLGVKEINGRPIKFVLEDDGSNPQTAKSAMEKLITMDKVDMVVGGYTSSCTAAMAGTAEDLGCPLVIDCGSADAITTKPNKWIFSGPRVPASHYGDALWGLIDKVIKPKTVALFYENTDWGTSSSKALRAGFKKRGIKIVFDQPYDSGAMTFMPMLTRIKSEKPDLVVAVSYLTDAIMLAKQSKQIRLDVPLYMGYAGGYTMPEFVDHCGKDVNYIASTTNWTPQAPWPGVKKYFEAYKKKYNKPPDYHGAQGYSAMQIAIDALQRASKPINRNSIRAALTKTDLMTVMGRIQNHDWTDNLGHHYYNQGLPLTYVIQWQNLKQQVVWPLKAKTANLIFPVPPYEKRK